MFQKCRALLFQGLSVAEQQGSSLPSLGLSSGGTSETCPNGVPLLRLFQLLLLLRQTSAQPALLSLPFPASSHASWSALQAASGGGEGAVVPLSALPSLTRQHYPKSGGCGGEGIGERENEERLLSVKELHFPRNSSHCIKCWGSESRHLLPYLPGFQA